MDPTQRKYPELKELDLPGIATKILAFWNKEEIFSRSLENRKGSPAFIFYEGPPSANGTPGIHHVLPRTIKDLFCRYKTLQGYRVERKGGWDTHGLPVELQVEKTLGITKEDIGKTISVEEYNARCRQAVMTYKDQWEDLTRKMGYWVDLAHPYITYEKDYIETLWWILTQLYNKKLLYKGYTIQPYSPAAGTGLSSHELNLPGTYRDVKDTSVVAQFKVIRNKKSDFLFVIDDVPVYILAWTTTPWTLPSNTALAVGQKIKYVLVETFNAYTHQRLCTVLAKDLLPKYFPGENKQVALSDYQPGDRMIPFKVHKEFTGQELSGIVYEQLITYEQPLYDSEKAFHVVIGDFVTTEEGTGVVHSSPTFGADDFRISKQYGIPPLTVRDESGIEQPTVDRKGKFVTGIGKRLSEAVAKYGIRTHKPLGPDDFYVKNYTNEDETSKDYKSTDTIISIILKEENKAFRVEKYEHAYPHCWRTDKPVLYYPLDAWFIRTTALKDRIIELNKTIHWKPLSTGTGRFGNWLENLVDWNLSRSRFWGTPLPIWRTRDGNEEKCIGSLEDLRAEIEQANKVLDSTKYGNQETTPADLHRPYVDDIVLATKKGEPMFREPDLVDVWFDSGAMPYAQWHYPFENRERVENEFPADFIAEGVDQTRGWFFTLHVLGVLLFDSVAYRNVVSNGLVLDKAGNKMSKSKGNSVDPFGAMADFGADALRWYMMENAPPWDNLKFDFDGLREVQRKFFGTLHNTYSFFALYANIDGFVKNEMRNVPFNELSTLDRWIVSRLQTLIQVVSKAYEEYEPTRAARALQEFVNDHLSNWYVRLNRRRFWQPSRRGELGTDKQGAYETLYQCLLVVAQLMSPIAPFYGDWLYLNLTENIRDQAIKHSTPLRFPSVHMTELVKPETKFIDAALDRSMDHAQRISSLVHSIRKQHKIKVRTPLKSVLLPILDPSFADEVRSVEDTILSEVNVKELQYVSDTSGLVVKKARPNLPRLGKQYGAKMKEVTAIVKGFAQEEIDRLDKQGSLEKDGYRFDREDVIISSEDIPGWAIANDGKLTVALDLHLTDELRQEGVARDLVNRIQNLRKEMGLNVLDKIRIWLEPEAADGEMLSAVLQSFGSYIKTETQATSLDASASAAGGVDVNLDDLHLRIKIQLADSLQEK